MKKIVDWLRNRHLISCIIFSLILNVFIEILSRRSINAGIYHIMFHPLRYLFNCVLIFFTYYITCLFRNRAFIKVLVSVIWLGLGIADFVILSKRITPLGFSDFKVLNSVFSIINVYLNKFEIVLIAVCFVAVIALLIYLFIKLPKQKVNYAKSIGLTLLVTAFTLVSTVFCQNTGIVSTRFKNLPSAYYDYGFVYCFLSTLVDRGIDRPSDYSQETIEQIKSEINNKDNTTVADKNKDETEENSDDLHPTEFPATKDYPNIIFLQLESFFDVNYLKDTTFSENPIPNFTKLKQDYTSGFLTVPVVGAGTANTEFEVISGMSLQFFGPGEYPYTTVLKSQTCETINYNLKELGYKTHAIHNHRGGFYGRNEVFSQLGFDDFTSIEYMKNVERNPIKWAKDSLLTGQIENVLESTPGRDMIYTISVQGHGVYPTEPVDEEEHTIKVGDSVIENKVGLEYYVNQLKEMDDFIGDLTKKLEEIGEPVILVMYGDHLPNFSITPEMISNDNIFQTEYVIWNNIGLNKADEDTYAYQLSSDVMNKLNFNNGVLTKFHLANKNKDNYLEELKLLEHDMLYGDKLIYNGNTPYTPTNLKMGIDDIKINAVEQMGDDVYIIGQNYTTYSQVFINDKKRKIKYRDDNIIIVEDIELSDGDILSVRQMTDEFNVLSKTDPFVYKIK